MYLKWYSGDTGPVWERFVRAGRHYSAACDSARRDRAGHCQPSPLRVHIYGSDPGGTLHGDEKHPRGLAVTRRRQGIYATYREYGHGSAVSRVNDKIMCVKLGRAISAVTPRLACQRHGE